MTQNMSWDSLRPCHHAS